MYLSSKESLDREPRQIRKDLERLLIEAAECETRVIPAFYSQEHEGREYTWTLTSGPSSELSPEATNVLEATLFMLLASEECGLRQNRATRLHLFHPKYVEFIRRKQGLKSEGEAIGYLLKCSERTVQRDIQQVFDKAIHLLRVSIRQAIASKHPIFVITDKI